MADYIDRQSLGIGRADRNAFTVPEYADGWNSAIEIIEKCHTVDVVPKSEVERLQVQKDDLEILVKDLRFRNKEFQKATK